MRIPWLPEEDQAMRLAYPDMKTAELAKLLQRPLSGVYQRAATLGLHKSEAFNTSELSGRVLRGRQNEAMKSTQFKPGQTPPNKGLRRPGWAPGRMAQTQFRKGEKRGAAQHNYVPIGSHRISKDGYLERKVTDNPDLYPAQRWTGVHRLAWESANGPVPAGHAVVFLPGRRTTEAEKITVDALEMVSRAELMRRNTRHRFPKELADLIAMKGALTRRINARSKAK